MDCNFLISVCNFINCGALLLCNILFLVFRSHRRCRIQIVNVTEKNLEFLKFYAHVIERYKRDSSSQLYVFYVVKSEVKIEEKSIKFVPRLFGDTAERENK